jgi:hypothetical protein
MRLEAYNKRSHLALDPDSASYVFVEKLQLTSDNSDSSIEHAYSSTLTYTLTGYATAPILFLHTRTSSLVDLSLTPSNTFSFALADSLVNVSPSVWELRLSFHKALSQSTSTQGDATPVIYHASLNVSDFELYVFSEIDPMADVSSDPFVMRKENGDVSFASSKKVMKAKAVYSSDVTPPTIYQTGWNSGNISGGFFPYQNKASTFHTMGTYSASEIASLKTNPTVVASGIPNEALDALATGGTLGISKPGIRLRVRSEVRSSTVVSYGFIGPATPWVPGFPPGNQFLPGGNMDWALNIPVPNSMVPEAPGLSDWDITLSTSPNYTAYLYHGTFSWAAGGYYNYSSWRQEVRPSVTLGPAHVAEAWIPVHAQLLSKSSVLSQILPNEYADLSAFAAVYDPVYSQNDCLTPMQNPYETGDYALESGTTYFIIDGADYD